MKRVMTRPLSSSSSTSPDKHMRELGEIHKTQKTYLSAYQEVNITSTIACKLALLLVLQNTTDVIMLRHGDRRRTTWEMLEARRMCTTE